MRRQDEALALPLRVQRIELLRPHVERRLDRRDAEEAARRRDAEVAIEFWGEDRVKGSVTYAELYH